MMVILMMVIDAGAPVFSGGNVDEKYFKDDLDLSADFTEIQVPRGVAHDLSIEVSKPGMMIKWEFRSVDYDIGFGLHRKGKCT
jgi:hypothetical protein